MSLRYIHYPLGDFYHILTEWWAKWKFPVVPLQTLPAQGLRLVAGDGPVLAATFILYPLDPTAKIALVEWTTANPEIEKPQRREALRLLMDGVADELKQVGLDFAVTYTSSDNFAKTLVEFGFIDSGEKYRMLLRPTAQRLQGSDVSPQS